MALNFLSVTWCGEGFPRLGVQGVKGLIPVVLYFCLMEEGEEKERKKKRGKKKKLPRRRRVSPRLDLPGWLCSTSQLSLAIKG
jgi:hypothetical protein